MAALPEIPECHRLEPPEPHWQEALEGVLISETQLKDRVTTLAACIAEDIRRPEDFVVLGMMSGAFMFVSDLVRHWRFPFQIDFMGMTSYGVEMTPGVLQGTLDPQISLRGKEVLLVEDILDTGRTLRAARSQLMAMEPASLKVCVLLDKGTAARSVHPAVDYVGFRVPDVFVVGYGLDHAYRYRHLPFVGVMASSMEEISC